LKHFPRCAVGLFRRLFFFLKSKNEKLQHEALILTNLLRFSPELVDCVFLSGIFPVLLDLTLNANVTAMNKCWAFNMIRSLLHAKILKSTDQYDGFIYECYSKLVFSGDEVSLSHIRILGQFIYENKKDMCFITPLIKPVTTMFEISKTSTEFLSSLQFLLTVCRWDVKKRPEFEMTTLQLMKLASMKTLSCPTFPKITLIDFFMSELEAVGIDINVHIEDSGIIIMLKDLFSNADDRQNKNSFITLYKVTLALSTGIEVLKTSGVISLMIEAFKATEYSSNPIVKFISMMVDKILRKTSD
jgi:hypothetical protein